MEWGINITKHENGYLLKPLEEGMPTKVVEIREDTIKGEQEALREVFYILREYFEVCNDKHSNAGKGQYLTIKVGGDEG